MNNSKYTNAPKIDPQTGKATLHSVDVPKTPELAPAATPIVTPAVTPVPVQAAPAPAEKEAQAMVNEGGNSVVINPPHNPPHAVREPSALMGTLPELPAAKGNGAAEPQAPAMEAKKPEGLNS